MLIYDNTQFIEQLSNVLFMKIGGSDGYEFILRFCLFKKALFMFPTFLSVSFKRILFLKNSLTYDFIHQFSLNVQ